MLCPLTTVYALGFTDYARFRPSTPSKNLDSVTPHTLTVSYGTERLYRNAHRVYTAATSWVWAP